MTYITFQATDTAQIDYLLAYAQKEKMQYEISDYKEKFEIYKKERAKLVKDFLLFAENNSIATSNFTFNREECYAR
jgi:hypothetical protein